MSAALLSSASRRPLRLFLALLVALAVGVGGNLAAWTAAQRARPPQDQGSRESGSRNEEEDPGAPKVKHKAIRVDEPPEPAKKPSAVGSADVDLKTAARQATHPDIKKLFEDLAVPHDQITIKNTLTQDRDDFISPLEDYIDDLSKVKTSIKVIAFNNKWEKEKPRNAEPSTLRKIVYYEQLAGERVKEFINLHRQDIGPGKPKNLTRLEKLLAAEQALSAVARFHEAARANETRKGSGWDDVRDALRAELLNYVLARLQLSIDKGDWDESLALAKQTAERFPLAKEQERIAAAMVPLLEKPFEIGFGENRFREVQRRLHELQELFPLSKAFEPVRKKLREPAEDLRKDAEREKKNGRLAEARKLLEQAEEIYPTLPGLHDLRQQVEEEHPTLRVAVRDLPIDLSPARARTESERQAVELLFEELIALGTEADGGRYRPVLALGRPQLIPLGRLFRLPRDAHWSNGEPLTSGDVQNTARALADRDWDGRTHAWVEDLFESAAPTDPFRIPLTLKQGYLEPLALMSFKVLPAGKLQKPDDENFAKNPVGSGPFKFMGSKSDPKGRPYVEFSANPYYRGRPGAPSRNLPYIRDIQFFESHEKDPDDKPERTDPVKELVEGKVDMVLDLSSKAAVEAAKERSVVVPPPMPNRRIYFLAINHRNPPLDNAALRRALNRAIPRTKLLNDYFRAGLGDKVHRPLNGPYPAGSWACDPSQKADPYDELDAKGQMDLLNKKAIRLSLKYPAGDPAVRDAMKSLSKHLESTLGVTLDLEARPLRRLIEDVEEAQDFELAYYWYDYPNPTFWLWPLLDSRSAQKGGRNYMGYINAEMEGLFRIVAGHRDFNEVRRYTHMIHRQFALKEVPFVPLWQLDRHVAFNDRVRLSDGARELPVAAGTPLPLDPLRIFATAGYWKVRRK